MVDYVIPATMMGGLSSRRECLDVCHKEKVIVLYSKQEKEHITIPHLDQLKSPLLAPPR